MSIGLLLPVLQFVEHDELPDEGMWSVLRGAFDLFRVPLNLASLLVGVLMLIVLAQLLVYLRTSETARLATRYTAQLQVRTFRSFLGAKMAFLQRAERGNLVNTLTMEANQAADSILAFVDFSARAMTVGVYVALLVLISLNISLLGLGLVLLGTVLVQFQIAHARRLGRMLVDMRDRYQGFVVERMEGMRQVKLSAMESAEEAVFQEHAEGLARGLHHRSASRAKIRLIMEPVIVGGGLLVVYLSVEVLNASLVELALFLYVLIRLGPEAMAMNTLYHSMSTTVASLESVASGMRRSEEDTVLSGVRPFDKVEREIRVEGVSYEYEAGHPVLRKVSFSLQRGELTAIIGPSGVGKSSLLDLLVRLADPTEGHILIDTVDLKEFDLTSLRRRTGVVSQDVVLFTETVMANLRYGHPEATDAEVYEAARKANAFEFVTGLPQGFDTVLGHRGLTISGGERQRLSMARALVGNPVILILDEVTNNLDAESSRLIRESIQVAAKETTVVMSTHDFSLIGMADKIVVMEEGQIMEEGHPDQLAAAGGPFWRFYGRFRGMETQDSPPPNDTSDLNESSA